jgi:ketosteroid isomerase-like protein
MSDHNVEAVRSIWRAYAGGGLDAVFAIADPNVEWVPFGGDGQVYRGHDGLRQFMERSRSGRRILAEPYSFTDLDPHVLVYGHYKAENSPDRQVFWLYCFREERLIRFEAFSEQGEALAAADARS